jgi:hypothetical protein
MRNGKKCMQRSEKGESKHIMETKNNYNFPRKLRKIENMQKVEKVS